jgi:ribosomal protein S7
MRAMREQLTKEVLRASEDRAPAVLRRSEQRRFSSTSDDEVGGSMRAMREQLTKEVLRAAHKRKVLA